MKGIINYIKKELGIIILKIKQILKGFINKLVKPIQILMRKIKICIKKRYKIIKSNYKLLRKEIKDKKKAFTLDDFFNSKLIRIFIVLVLFITFKGKVESLFNEYFINIVFNGFSEKPILDVIFLLSGIFILAYIVYKVCVNFSMSSGQIYLLIAIFSIYSYYRVFNTQLDNFTKFTFSNFFAYLDIIFLLASYPLGKIIRFLAIPLKKEDKNKYFIEDNPIEYEASKKDEVKDNNFYGPRSKFAEDLANKIIKQSFANSFSIGIVGSWGSGKTSFINLIEKYLIEHQVKKDDTIIIHADPRYNHDEKNIIINFFDKLSSSLRKFNSGISKQFDDYRDNLMNIDDSNSLKLINDTINLINHDKPSSAKEQYDEINKALIKTGKKLIIIIDDLDRLSAEEILEVLKLIRNTANFKNTVYILAYDKDYIIKTIKDKINYQSKNFIEKYVQLEFHLPNINSVDLGNRFYEIVNGILTQKEKDTLLNEMIRNDDELRINSLIHLQLKHYRDVILLANIFLFEFPLIREDVYIVDFINLEILKLKYFSIYTLLANNYDEFLTTEHHLLQLPQPLYAFNTEEEGEKVTNIDKSKLFIIHYIEKDKKIYDFSENELINIEDILISLFPKNPTYLVGGVPHLSIKSPEHIYKYFKLNLISSDISEKDFMNIFYDEEQFTNSLKDWLKYKRVEGILKKLLYYSKKASNEAELFKIINALFYIANNTTKSNIPLEVVNALSYIISNSLKKHIAPKIVIEYIIANYLIIDKVRDPFIFEGHLVSELIKLSEKLGAELIKKLKKLLYEYYQKNVYESTKLEFVNNYLFHYNFELQEDKEKVRKVLIEFIRTKAFKDFISQVAIKPDIAQSRMFELDEYLKKLFGSFPQFYEFINKLPEDKFILELKDFCSLFKIRGNKDYLRYDFDEIKVSVLEKGKHDGTNIKQIFLRICNKKFQQNIRNNHEWNNLFLPTSINIYLSGEIIMFYGASLSSVEELLESIIKVFKVQLLNVLNKTKDKITINKKAKNKDDVLVYLDEKPLIEIISIQPRININIDDYTPY